MMLFSFEPRRVPQLEYLSGGKCGGSTICCEQSGIVFLNINVAVSYLKSTVRNLVNMEFPLVIPGGNSIRWCWKPVAVLCIEVRFSC